MSSARFARPRCIAAALLTLVGLCAHAAPLTDDSPAGMTCWFLAALPDMAWSQPGGDWADAKGEFRGGQPYAKETVRREREPQRLELDATALVRAWDQPGAWAGAVALLGQPGGGNGTVELASREHAERSFHPELVLTWADGRTERLRTAADAHLPCPNYRSAGDSPVMKLGSGGMAVLLFERPAGWRSAGLVRARLGLWSTRQTGAGAAIALFAASLPRAEPAAADNGIAARYPRDEGLERDPNVLLVERFEAAPRQLKWLERDDLDFVSRASPTDRQADFEPLQGAALAVVVRKGSHRGMNTRIAMQPLAGSQPEELYFRYHLRFGRDWDPFLDGGKLPGFAGTYGRAGWGGRPADGFNGWSARGKFSQQAGPGSALTDLRGVGSYVYHVRKDRHGETMGWNLGAGGWLQKNRWYSIEQHLRLNTPGRNDGVLRAWVDGRLVFERRDLRWRDVETLRIETLWMNIYHGGSKPAPQDMTMFIDNLVVARQYIGPLSFAPSLSAR